MLSYSQLAVDTRPSLPPQSRQRAAFSELPLWPLSTRGIPNAILRSALCAAIGKGKRAYLERKVLASYKGVSILYTGQQLDQGDMSVWLMVLHFSRLRRAKIGESFRFTAYDMLKALRKVDTGGNRKVLHTRLLRLKANGIEITHGTRTYVGSLLAFFERNEGTGEYVITLDPQILPFFDEDQFTQVSWDVRLDLEGKPLAQWLHSFYESHEKPFPLKVESLMRWSGSENRQQRSAKQKLQLALDAVKDACIHHGTVLHWSIENDLVQVRWGQ